MIAALRRRWATRHWVRCACSQRRIAPGTATEVGGVKHTEQTCFLCDEYGLPL